MVVIDIGSISSGWTGAAARGIGGKRRRRFGYGPAASSTSGATGSSTADTMSWAGTGAIHESFIKRLGVRSQLDGHTGCVNRLAWNPSGSILATGSDDRQVRLWDYGTGKCRATLDTGHSANIFGVKFTCDNAHIVSGAMDQQVRVMNIESEECISHFVCHRARVKDVTTHPSNASIYWSAGEDGTCRQFDLRERHSCSDDRKIGSGCRNTIIRVTPRDPVRTIGLKGISVHPFDPNYVSFPCGDPYVRTYDLRRAGTVATAASATAQSQKALVQAFAPRGCNKSFHATYLHHSATNHEMCVSYSGESVFLWNTYQPPITMAAISAGAPLPRPPMNLPSPLRSESASSSAAVPVPAPTSQHESKDSVEDMDERSDNTLPIDASFPLFLPATSAPFPSPSPSPSPSSTNVPSSSSPTLLSSPAAPPSSSPSSPMIGPMPSSSSTPSYPLSINSIAETHKQKGNKSFAAGDWSAALVHYTAAIHAQAGYCPMPSYGWHHLSSVYLLANNSDDHPVLYSNRAQAYLKRNYPGDAQEALNDADRAIDLDHTFAKAYYSRARALHLLGFKERALSIARECEVRFPSMTEPFSFGVLRQSYEKERREAMEAREKKEKERKEQKQRRAAARASSTTSGSSASTAASMRRRFMVSDEDDEENGGGAAADSDDDGDEKVPAEPREEMESVNDFDPGVLIRDYRQRFVGHINTQTDIKEAVIWGAFVLSGSDDGRVFIWHKMTGRLINVLNASSDIINCVQPHPFDCTLATSGIDHHIKLWSSIAEEPVSESFQSVVETNQKRLAERDDDEGGIGMNPLLLHLIMSGQIDLGRLMLARMRGRPAAGDDDDDDE